jgi:DNA-binding XRE family transcriptional regulator
MSLGNKIKEAREKAKISQDSLAKKVDITVSTIYKIETDKTNPSFQVVDKIAKALGISLDSLR